MAVMAIFARGVVSWACLLLTVTLIAGCTPLTHQTRAARSSLGCMQAATQGRNFDAQDELAHCFAAGLIARHCSVGEAMMASVGKELRDTFGAGDAQWQDLVADRRGIRCAQQASSDAELERCCSNAAVP
jgi:hypothetical protein